jgi:hypothetical protein
VSGADSTNDRERDRRLGQLLEDAEAAAGPVAWPRVEAAITALVDFYGRGLTRVLTHARDAIGDGGPDLEQRLESDELVASLLVLHGLCSTATEERLTRALGAEPARDTSVDGLVPADRLVRKKAP